MAVLIRRSFQETHCREIASIQPFEKVANVVLMIRLILLADHIYGAGGRVMPIRGGLIKLERIVVRNVVRHRWRPIELAVLRRAHRGSIGVPGAGSEAALEPTPRDPFLIEEIAHVEAGHRYGVRGRRHTIVKRRTNVVDDGTVQQRRRRSSSVVRYGGSIRLSRYEIQVPERRWTEVGTEEVVIHGKVLSVIPECSHGVSVVVTHHEPFAQAQVVTSCLGRPVELD